MYMLEGRFTCETPEKICNKEDGRYETCAYCSRILFYESRNVGLYASIYVCVVYKVHVLVSECPKLLM